MPCLSWKFHKILSEFFFYMRIQMRTLTRETGEKRLSHRLFESLLEPDEVTLQTLLLHWLFAPACYLGYDAARLKHTQNSQHTGGQFTRPTLLHQSTSNTPFSLPTLSMATPLCHCCHYQHHQWLPQWLIFLPPSHLPVHYTSFFAQLSSN